MSSTVERRMHARRALVVRRMVLCIAFMSLLAACGTPDQPASGPTTAESTPTAGSAPTTPGATETTVLRASFLPSAGFATLVLGQEEGVFGEAGLEVERVAVQDVTASIAALEGGTQEIGIATVGTAAVARQEGLDVRMIAPYYYSNGDLGIYAEAGSPIQRARDLEGRTVGFGQLKTSGNAAMLEAVAQDGGDPSTVTFRLVPLATAATSLVEGQIEATLLAEPFITMSGDQIQPVIRDFHESVAENAPVAYAVTSGEYYDENPEVIQRFQAALLEANTLAAEDPELVRETIASYSEIPEDIVSSMTLPAYGADLKKEEAQEELELMQKYGYIDSVPDVNELFIDE